MLAEAFGKEVKTFYQSAVSTPVLPLELDLLVLYVSFTGRKHDIYQKEKLRVSLNNVAAIALREHHLTFRHRASSI